MEKKNKSNNISKIDSRNSNIEFLRIASMILIIMHHFMLYGVSLETHPYVLDRLAYNWFLIGGKIGVDIFILISAYFMVNSRFTLKKFFIIVGQTLFYSFVFYFIFKTARPDMADYSLNEFLRNLFPITFSKYWFITSYILLMIASPLINKAINNMSQKTHILCAIGGVFVFSILQKFTTARLLTNSFLWFIELYFIASYIRKYGITIRPFKGILVSFIFYILVIIFSFRDVSFSDQESLLTLIISLGAVLAFVSMKPRKSQIINILSAASFGVYLIHENIYVRQYLWFELIKPQELYGSGNLLLFGIASVILVFSVTSFIEIIRLLTLDRLWKAYVERVIIPIVDYKKSQLVKTISTLEERLKKKEHFVQGVFTKVTILAIIAFLIVAIALTTGPVLTRSINAHKNLVVKINIISIWITNITLLYLPLGILLFGSIRNIRRIYQASEDKLTFVVKILIRTTICVWLITMLLRFKELQLMQIVEGYVIGKNEVYIYWAIMLVILAISYSDANLAFRKNKIKSL